MAHEDPSRLGDYWLSKLSYTGSLYPTIYNVRNYAGYVRLNNRDFEYFALRLAHLRRR